MRMPFSTLMIPVAPSKDTGFPTLNDPVVVALPLMRKVLSIVELAFTKIPAVEDVGESAFVQIVSQAPGVCTVMVLGISASVNAAHVSAPEAAIAFAN